MNELAPKGCIYKCRACGKTSKTSYGFYDDGSSQGSDYMPDGTPVADKGWDESCMLNASLVKQFTPGIDDVLDRGWPEPKW